MGISFSGKGVFCKNGGNDLYALLTQSGGNFLAYLGNACEVFNMPQQGYTYQPRAAPWVEVVITMYLERVRHERVIRSDSRKRMPPPYRMSCPFRAHFQTIPIPRALPWASMSSSFRAFFGASRKGHALLNNVKQCSLRIEVLFRRMNRFVTFRRKKS